MDLARPDSREMRPPNILLDRFVDGRPAPFATAGERPWKEAVAAALSATPPKPHGSFLELDFAIAPAVGYARGADLDNFCEPVFSVLANRLGWFGGRRPNIQAFRARKTLAEPTGCRIRIFGERWHDPRIEGSVLLDGVSAGPLPLSARDEAFARWVAGAMVRPAAPGPLVAVELRFSGAVNLGDIATGRVKNVIDCLYPVLGGSPGAPNDSRIELLEATRTDANVDGAVRVRVVEQMGAVPASLKGLDPAPSR